jgi:isopenicillin N synthase-like dioxygenase
MTVPEFTIPTVDISPYLSDPNSPASHQIIADVANACRTSGFFQITGHGISPTLQQKVFSGSKKLFSLPTEEKEKIKGVVGRGYEILGGQTLQQGTKPDMKEGFFVGPEIADNRESYRDYRHPNKWPSSSLIPDAELKDPVLEYRNQLCNLSVAIMQILAEGLPNGERNMFNDFCHDPLAVVRLLHYPPQPSLSDPTQLGAGAHTDFGAITLLLQDSAGGLQVLNQTTSEWIDVPPNAEAYVVNVGDMLEMWTRGAYRSNVHRVINRSGGDRYSVPFFFDGNLSFVIRPLDRSGGEGVTVEEFMNERYARTYPK